MFKKHYTQMTQAELEAVAGAVHDLKVRVGYHTAERMAEKRITEAELREAVAAGEVIEFEVEPRGVKALLRRIIGRRAVCVVVNIDSGLAVTAWTNAASDNHRTLDASAYQMRDDVRNYLR